MEKFFYYTSLFFLVYLVIYITFLCSGVAVGAYRLYTKRCLKKVRNELQHQFYFPVSILVPAYNEEVTIVDTVVSLLKLDYKLYEIVVIDDGSKDETSSTLVTYFNMQQVERPIRRRIPCKEVKAIYETTCGNVRITLVKKENGGKGDALNMGINVAQNPYFLCVDADSLLQADSLENLVRPLLEDDETIAVGGMIRIAQCMRMENGKVVDEKLPWNPLIGVQAMEYIRSFFASRIFMDNFNGNLIISGAFGLFKKETVIAAGGYATDTLGEDMDIVVRLHLYCRNNGIKYAIKYEPSAVCWTQVPTRLRDLLKQRRRWYLGLMECMLKYRQMLGSVRFGLLGAVSYQYYLAYELLAPVVECFGMVVIGLGFATGLVNMHFFVQFFLFYSAYNIILTQAAFFQRLYVQDFRVSFGVLLKAIVWSIAENLVFRYVISFVRLTAFIGYRKKGRQWGEIQRVNHYQSGDQHTDLPM